MCFANRSRCKRCHKETIQYVSKCDQYPEVTTETATHAIRGRHRQIISCKECRRRERQEAHEQGELNAVQHEQAKAIIEWQNLERPLPLTDEAIARKYRDLYLNKERLHPYCIGFTDIHRHHIESRRQRIAIRLRDLKEALGEVEHGLSDIETQIITIALSQGDLFEECLKRQAEIDSGARTMTESDKTYSLHVVGRAQHHSKAMAAIEGAKKRNTFGTWTAEFPDSFVAEQRVRWEILAYISALEESNVDGGIIDNFINQVLQEFKLDEETFDFDPKSRVWPGETLRHGEVEDRKTFCEWKIEHDKLTESLKGQLDRWYELLDGYRDYLATCAPARSIIFSIARDAVAERIFRALTGRPATVPEPEQHEPQPQDDSDDADDECSLSDDPESDPSEEEVTPTRRRLQQSILGLEQLFQLANELTRNFQGQFSTAAANLNQAINFLDDHITDVSYPTEAEWEIVQRYATNAIEILSQLHDEQNARASRQAEQLRDQHESTPESESESDFDHSIFCMLDLPGRLSDNEDQIEEEEEEEEEEDDCEVRSDELFDEDEHLF